MFIWLLHLKINKFSFCSCTSSMKKCVINIASHHMSSKMRARHKHATWQQNNILISSQIQNNENLNVKMIIRSKKRQIINSNLEKQAKKLTSSDKRIKNKTSWADLKRNKIKRKKMVWKSTIHEALHNIQL